MIWKLREIYYLLLQQMVTCSANPLVICRALSISMEACIINRCLDYNLGFWQWWYKISFFVLLILIFDFYYRGSLMSLMYVILCSGTEPNTTLCLWLLSFLFLSPLYPCANLVLESPSQATHDQPSLASESFQPPLEIWVITTYDNHMHKIHCKLDNRFFSSFC